MNQLCENTFQNVKKFWHKIPHIHIDIIYSYTSFLGKWNFLVSHVKKTNIYAPTWLFTRHVLSFLHRPHKIFFLPKNLCASIECWDVHSKIYFRIFCHFWKFVFNAFFIIGSYAPMSQNTTSGIHHKKSITTRICLGYKQMSKGRDNLLMNHCTQYLL
jgi:hypothetical protein